MAILELTHVWKFFDNEERAAVEDFNLETEEGEFIVLVGPSGCGKTTTMRMIAGLEEPTRGDIRINGTSVTRTPPGKRDIAMVFQNYALYPHMSVRQNLSFSLQIRKEKKAAIESRVNAVSEMLDITSLLDRKPAALSGGQQQRVALGRAIIREPRVFLMDEPLSNLDARLRSEMRKEIVKLQRALNITTIYVTHDQTEAMTMGHRIVVLKDGVIQQIGTPADLYESPANTFVGGFIGTPAMNLFMFRDIAADQRHTWAAALPRITSRDEINSEDIIFGLRPEALRIGKASEGSPGFRGCVELVEPLGDRVILQTKCGEISFAAQVQSTGRWRIGEPVELIFDWGSLHLFDARRGGLACRGSLRHGGEDMPRY